MSKDKKPSSKKRQFETLFRRGTELLKRGDMSKAAQLLQRAHQLDPQHVDVAINLSGAYILAKKFKKAVAVLEPLSRTDSDHVMLWTNLGAAYLGNPIIANNEEQLQAIDAFKRALDLNPIAPNVAYNIGLIYRDRREYDKAIQWFERAIKANPNDKDARILIERIQQKQAENPSENA
ncbi:MAG: tetratricopeptide repeat protein [Chloroflexi bacterium]|nr:MAG: tetratricopeptide repeat protein [Chloroflexota bacterium]